MCGPVARFGPVALWALCGAAAEKRVWEYVRASPCTLDGITIGGAGGCTRRRSKTDCSGGILGQGGRSETCRSHAVSWTRNEADFVGRGYRVWWTGEICRWEGGTEELAMEES